MIAAGCQSRYNIANMAHRRTKRQKQIAILRRKLEVLQGRSSLPSVDASPVKNPAERIIVPKEKKEEQVKTAVQSLYNPLWIKKDLKKTLTVAVFFLGMVMGLWYLLEQNGLMLIRGWLGW